IYLPLGVVPHHHKLAEAITADFLTHWRQLQLVSPFLIPHYTPCQITQN
ncbi:hypothetical protein VP01_3465g2, partial [Puccinia sorghi]